MTTVPRTPADHYAEAARLLAAAESSRTESIQTVDALIAIGHAIMATVPKRRARQRPKSAPAVPTSGGSPRQQWLSGQDDDEEGGQR